MKIKQAVILAGGKGIRLRPLTLNTPKPLIKINGKPFLEYLIELLKDNGIKEIVLLVGYLGNQIEEYFGNGEKFGLKIKYSYSSVESETGSRIANAYKFLDKKFILLYCDNYCPLDLKALTKYYINSGKSALVTVYDNKDGYTKNNIHIDKTGLVTTYDKNRNKKKLNAVEIGFFILDNNIFRNTPKANFSFEKVIIPKLIRQKQLIGFLTPQKYAGLSNLKRIADIKKYFLNNKIIFLDRDGVINKKPYKGEYVKKWDEFKFLPKAIEGLRYIRSKGYKIFIITNQAGVGRGVMTENNLKKIHKEMTSYLKKKNIKIEKIYYCPHDFNANCECRKPKPGMLFKAAIENKFNLAKSIFIGDDTRDRLAAKKAGAKFIKISSNGNLLELVKAKL